MSNTQHETGRTPPCTGGHECASGRSPASDWDGRTWTLLNSSGSPSGGPAVLSAGTIGQIKKRTWTQRHTLFVDVTVATLGSAPTLWQRPDETTSDLPVAVVAGLGAVAFVLLLLRRRYPLPVLVVSVLAATALLATDGPTILVFVALIALYTFAEAANRVAALLAGAGTATLLYTGSCLASTSSWTAAQNVQLIAWSGLAAAAGDVVRNRRAERAAIEERIARAERSVEDESRRRVVEERLRIARELHDVIAHHIAVINVQAAVAAHLLREDPDGANDALTQVRLGGRSVLDEMGSILAVLRDTDAGSSSLEPLPSLDRLEELVRSFDIAGLVVDWRTTGTTQPLPPALSLTAYRIVQESLTNVHKHGGGAKARLRICYERDALTIEVVNLGGTPPYRSSNGGGHGTTGMRERVATVGGTLEVGHTSDGQYRIQARLPVAATAT